MKFLLLLEKAKAQQKFFVFQDVLKMSSAQQFVTFQYVFKTSLQDSFKMSSRRVHQVDCLLESSNNAIKEHDLFCNHLALKAFLY